jgi:O-antigen/teichoic acid export membrane protein
MGIMGAAITTLAAYAAMFVASVIWSRKHYPVPYAWGKLGAMVGSATVMVVLIHYTQIQSTYLKLGLGLAYIFVMLWVERKGLFKSLLGS